MTKEDHYKQGPSPGMWGILLTPAALRSHMVSLKHQHPTSQAFSGRTAPQPVRDTSEIEASALRLLLFICIALFCFVYWMVLAGLLQQSKAFFTSPSAPFLQMQTRTLMGFHLCRRPRVLERPWRPPCLSPHAFPSLWGEAESC